MCSRRALLVDGELGIMLLWVCGLVQWIADSVYHYVAPIGGNVESLQLIRTLTHSPHEV